MKKCKKCGFTTENNVIIYCIKCGAKLTDASDIKEGKSAGDVNASEICISPKSDYSTSASASKTQNRTAGIIAACAGAVALIAVGAVLAGSQDHGNIITEQNIQLVTAAPVETKSTAQSIIASSTETKPETIAETISVLTETSLETVTDKSPENKNYSDSFICDEISYYDMMSCGRYALSDKMLTITNRMHRLNKTTSDGEKLMFFINCPYIEGTECDDRLNRCIENELYDHCFDMTESTGELRYLRSDINELTAYIVDISDDHIVFDVDTLFFQNNDSNVWGENYKYLAFDLHDGHCIEMSELFNNGNREFLFDAKDKLYEWASKNDLSDDVPFVFIPELTKEYMCDPAGWLFSYEKMRFIYPMYWGAGRSCMEFTVDIPSDDIIGLLTDYGKHLAVSPKAEYYPIAQEDTFTSEYFDKYCSIYKNKKYGTEAVYPSDMVCIQFSEDGAVFSDGSGMTMEIFCSDNYYYSDIEDYLEDIKESEPRISYSYFNDENNYCGYTFFSDNTQAEIVYCVAKLSPDHISTMKLTYKSNNEKTTDYYDRVLESILSFSKS